ncbi:hypothetical protein LTR99_001643 [Exophiala xenobiotica]|uniref:DUF1907 domain-containing protein n=1 Tax=Vermiconidia calcicola TaxID=1690605 RepID=A0AAV9QNB6_9PEZI|nr:hypothetical protein LTR72_000942 [Exophiala xenobiotica]KAK5544153.1 hypothetical protein LTR25_001768 [Vermiconidia calcicola]KAK5547567.1 hypothetical protein LTR23_002320 [Chaetothyriales sp. CCFEE 6169]KAK5271199.1 hypothetical protein LTR96_003023 [Exophiala xenobiotica]KAK5289677.1 hypothetical protein LTR14_007315 [Exophiala xenobiotica]
MSTDEKWPIKKVILSPPPLSDLASAISLGLSSNFAESSCTVETPPDLTLPPYHLAGPGLTGSARVVEVGDPSYLITSDFTRRYDLRAISRQTDMSPSSGLMIGAGAGPFYVLGQNSELMPNFAYGTAAGATGSPKEATRNRTHYAKITPSDGVSCCRLPDSSGFGLMCNLFCCDGTPGPCLHIKAKSRTGRDNSLTRTIQKAVKAAFDNNQLVSLGGVFLIKSGKANLHVMPDFPASPGFNNHDDVEKWLRYFDMEFGRDSPEGEGPLVCLSVLHAGDDKGLGLRMEHTHCFTEAKEDGSGSTETGTSKGGHYHYDLDETRGEVEYEGWFNVAECVYRVDPPTS